MDLSWIFLQDFGDGHRDSDWVSLSSLWLTDLQQSLGSLSVVMPAPVGLNGLAPLG